VDITPPMMKVVDAAVAKAYGGKKKIQWMEVYAGEKSVKVYGNDTWLPDETMQAVREYVVSIKGPLTKPISGCIRSLNVALRQMLDLYVCLRPVRWFKGVPSPVKEPGKVDMVIFRENTEERRSSSTCDSRKTPIKKPATFVAGFFTAQAGLTRLDVGGLLALGTLNNFKGHFLTFFERLEAAHVDRGEMREQVFAAIIGSNKTKTLCIVEPLNSTVCHA
jgi:hypothetical protein